MAYIKTIKKFPYKGLAYNLLVSIAGIKDSKKEKLFIDGLVHPDFILYNNKGYPEKISEISINEIILFNENKKWKIEEIIKEEVNEFFFEIKLSDDRIIKVSNYYKLLVNPLKYLTINELNINDEIESPALHLIGAYVRNAERS